MGRSVLTKPESIVALVVRVGSGRFALPVHFVAEVLPALPYEPLVSECPGLLGALMVRGDLHLVWRARVMFGMKDAAAVEEPNIICLRNQSHSIGLEVDEAIDLTTVRPGASRAIEGIPDGNSFVAEYREHDGALLGMLDVDALFAAAGSQTSVPMQNSPA